MRLSDSFQVAALVEKLSPLWEENCSKHKHKKMEIEDIIFRLRIEEDNRKSKKRSGGHQSMKSNANIVELGSKANN